MLHVFAHIYTNHVLLIVKQSFGKRFAKLGLADARRSEEEEGAYRAVRVLYARTRTEYCVRNALHRFILTDDTVVKLLVEMQELLPFALNELGYGDTRPA